MWLSHLAGLLGAFFESSILEKENIVKTKKIPHSLVLKCLLHVILSVLCSNVTISEAVYDSGSKVSFGEGSLNFNSLKPLLGERQEVPMEASGNSFVSSFSTLVQGTELQWLGLAVSVFTPEPSLQSHCAILEQLSLEEKLTLRSTMDVQYGVATGRDQASE